MPVSRSQPSAATPAGAHVASMNRQPPRVKEQESECCKPMGKPYNRSIPTCRLLPVRRIGRFRRRHRLLLATQRQVREPTMRGGRRRAVAAGRPRRRHGKRQHRRREYAAAGDAGAAERLLAGASRDRWRRRPWERGRQGRHVEGADRAQRSSVGECRDDRRQGVAALGGGCGRIGLRWHDRAVTKCASLLAHQGIPVAAIGKQEARADGRPVPLGTRVRWDLEGSALGQEGLHSGRMPVSVHH